MSELTSTQTQQNPPPLDVRLGCPAVIDPSRTRPTIDLLSPIQIEGVRFKNRIVVSPMCQYCAVDGLADDWHLVHLGSRAVGGAGLIFVEASAVLPEGRITHGDLGIWGDQHIEPLARIARFLESQGTVPGIQIAHAGRKASCELPWLGGARLKPPHPNAWDVVAPSPIPFRDDEPTPIELDHDGIDRVVDAFGAATRRAVKAGFRIIEIHMAHGYLLHEFLSPLSNHRTDEYGGSLENRFRLPIRVVKAVKAEIPDGSPLFVRISATDWVDGGWDLEQSVELGKAFCQAGVKVIDVSSGALVPYAKIPVAKGFQVPFAATIRRESGVGTGAVGMITEPHHANEIITSGAADLVFLAREMLRDPYWPIHAEQALHKPTTWPIQYGYVVEPKRS
jgi:2,4-dienoyl-CoA reductase (NADPH2)